ncbi:MAG: LLM class flavin-dependent oxidoreductase, partial [Sciscionella sp.]
WRREKVVHDGKHYRIPLPAEEGTGLGKPLKIINHPVRDRIPIVLASIGPKNVAMTAEIAEGWEPIFFHPEKAADVWGESLAAGKAKRDPALGELQVYVGTALAIGEDVEPLLQGVRPMLALYIGGMGAKGKNFYNDLARRYGYEAEAERIQDLYLDGKREEAAAQVPDDLVRAVSLIGPSGYVKERVAAFAEAGVTTLNVTPLAGDREGRVKLIEQFRDLID